MQWPGDENKNEDTKFRFQCENFECQPGRLKFHAVYEEPGPALVPSGMDCPYCGTQAVWVMDGMPAAHIRGSARGHQNPHYTPAAAESEHKWMADQIGEAKSALSGEDQITGKSASPYSKKTINHEEAEKAGWCKKRTAEDSATRKRIMDERNRTVAEQSADKLTDIDNKHVGRRHDG